MLTALSHLVGSSLARLSSDMTWPSAFDNTERGAWPAICAHQLGSARCSSLRPTLLLPMLPLSGSSVMGSPLRLVKLPPCCKPANTRLLLSRFRLMFYKPIVRMGAYHANPCESLPSSSGSSQGSYWWTPLRHSFVANKARTYGV